MSKYFSADNTVSDNIDIVLAIMRNRELVVLSNSVILVSEIFRVNSIEIVASNKDSKFLVEENWVIFQ